MPRRFKRAVPKPAPRKLKAAGALAGKRPTTARTAEKAAYLEALEALFDDISCEHEVTMRYALELYRDNALDFADCILAARAVIEDAQVLTFDKKLNRLLERLG